MMYALIVKYNTGEYQFFPSAKAASAAWGCSNQAVLDMWRKGRLNQSRIAKKLGIIEIKEVQSLEQLQNLS